MIREASRPYDEFERMNDLDLVYAMTGVAPVYGVGELKRLLLKRPSEIDACFGKGKIAKTGARRLSAAIEFAKRLTNVAGDESVPMSCAQELVAKYSRLIHEPAEVFLAVAVNGRNKIVGEWEVARGWESGVNLTARQVFTLLVKENVGRVIFLHNHPSGDPAPSVEDIRFTRRLIEAAQFLDIRVLDHIILAANGYKAMRTECAMELTFG